MSLSASPKKEMPRIVQYANGGLAGMGAAAITQPFDFVKVRMQVAKPGEFKGPVDVIVKSVRTEGILGLYQGLSAGLLRQATYTTTRMGVYQSLLGYYNDTYKTKPTVLPNMLLATIAGACGAFAGTPAEVLLIRMMSDGRQPPELRRNYKGLGDAFGRIVREEGFFNLWRGCSTTVVRAMVVNMTQLASYSQFKMAFKNWFSLEEGLLLHFTSSLTSGFLTAFISLPIDIVKTKIQNMKIIDGKPEYSGSMDVLLKILRTDGFVSLWRGFVPYFLRIGPTTIFTFLFLEKLNYSYKKYVLGTDDGSSL